jgi:hypothetical protein
MIPRFSPRTASLAFSVTGLLTGLVLTGCNGSATVTVDGGVDKPTQNLGEAGMKLDSKTIDLVAVEAPPPLPPAPPPNAASKTAAKGRARLIGSLVDACSNQEPASGNGDRWCAFSLPDKVIGKTDLWVINATKLANGTAITCNGTDANCLLLTPDLWTGVPMGNVPKYPTIHRFDGDTLIFHANTPSTVAEYKGPIFAWRPGWTAAKQISTNAGFNCSASPTSEVYICVENLSPDMVDPFQFDLTAGKLSAPGPMITPTVVGRITPQRAGTTSSQWRVSITRAGDYVVWSTGGTTTADTETLYALKYDDLGTAAAKTVKVLSGVSRWSLSADNTKVFFFRNYNYPAAGVDPAGNLAMADFPSGMNEVALAPTVAAFQVLVTGTGTDGGIGFFDTVKSGTATYKIIKDRAKPTEITTVVSAIPGILALSRDLKYLYYYKQFDPDNGTTDGYIAKTDGTGSSCTLTTSTASDQYGTAFTPNGQQVFWVDNIDFAEGVGEAWVANPEGCTGKKKWADQMDFWFLHGDEGMVFSDSAGGEISKLKYVNFPNGNSIGNPTLIQDQIARIYAISSDESMVLYNIAGSTAAQDGLFVYKTPFAPGGNGADGGAPADSGTPPAADASAGQ